MSTNEEAYLHFPFFIHPLVCSFISVTVTDHLPWAFKVACFFISILFLFYLNLEAFRNSHHPLTAPSIAILGMWDKEEENWGSPEERGGIGVLARVQRSPGPGVARRAGRGVCRQKEGCMRLAALNPA